MTEHETPAWFADAQCLGLPTAWWHPEKLGDAEPGGYNDVYRQARIVCNGCPVREQCLDHAIEHRETNGMWGGRTPRQRRGDARTKLRALICGHCSKRFRSSHGRASYWSVSCRRAASKRRERATA